jgi:hypothetical protein
MSYFCTEPRNGVQRLTNSMEPSCSWEMNSCSATQKNFHHLIYRTGRLNTVFTKVCHLSLPQPDQSIPYKPALFSFRCILILFSHLHADLTAVSFLFFFSRKNPVCGPLSPIRAWCLIPVIVLDLVTRIRFSEEYTLRSSSLWNSSTSCYSILFRFNYSPRPIILNIKVSYILIFSC